MRQVAALRLAVAVVGVPSLCAAANSEKNTEDSRGAVASTAATDSGEQTCPVNLPLNYKQYNRPTYWQQQVTAVFTRLRRDKGRVDKDDFLAEIYDSGCNTLELPTKDFRMFLRASFPGNCFANLKEFLTEKAFACDFARTTLLVYRGINLNQRSALLTSTEWSTLKDTIGTSIDELYGTISFPLIDGSCIVAWPGERRLRCCLLPCAGVRRGQGKNNPSWADQRAAVEKLVEHTISSTLRLYCPLGQRNPVTAIMWKHYITNLEVTGQLPCLGSFIKTAISRGFRYHIVPYDAYQAWAKEAEYESPVDDDQKEFVNQELFTCRFSFTGAQSHQILMIFQPRKAVRLKAQRASRWTAENWRVISTKLACRLQRSAPGDIRQKYVVVWKGNRTCFIPSAYWHPRGDNEAWLKRDMDAVKHLECTWSPHSVCSCGCIKPP